MLDVILLLEKSYFCCKKRIDFPKVPWMPDSLSGSVVWWWSNTCYYQCASFLSALVIRGYLYILDDLLLGKIQYIVFLLTFSRKLPSTIFLVNLNENNYVLLVG